MKRFILNFVVFVDNTRRKIAIYRPNWGACPHLGATRPRVGIC